MKNKHTHLYTNTDINSESERRLLKFSGEAPSEVAEPESIPDTPEGASLDINVEAESAVEVTRKAFADMTLEEQEPYIINMTFGHLYEVADDGTTQLRPNVSEADLNLCLQNVHRFPDRPGWAGLENTEDLRVSLYKGDFLKDFTETLQNKIVNPNDHKRMLDLRTLNNVEDYVNQEYGNMDINAERELELREVQKYYEAPPNDSWGTLPRYGISDIAGNVFIYKRADVLQVDAESGRNIRRNVLLAYAPEGGSQYCIPGEGSNGETWITNVNPEDFGLTRQEIIDAYDRTALTSSVSDGNRATAASNRDFERNILRGKYFGSTGDYLGSNNDRVARRLLFMMGDSVSEYSPVPVVSTQEDVSETEEETVVAAPEEIQAPITFDQIDPSSPSDTGVGGEVENPETSSKSSSSPSDRTDLYNDSLNGVDLLLEETPIDINGQEVSFRKNQETNEMNLDINGETYVYTNNISGEPIILESNLLFDRNSREFVFRNESISEQEIFNFVDSKTSIV